MISLREIINTVEQSKRISYQIECVGLYLAFHKNNKTLFATIHPELKMRQIWQRFPHLNLQKTDLGIRVTFPCCDTAKASLPMQP